MSHYYLCVMCSYSCFSILHYSWYPLIRLDYSHSEPTMRQNSIGLMGSEYRNRNLQLRITGVKANYSCQPYYFQKLMLNIMNNTRYLISILKELPLRHDEFQPLLFLLLIILILKKKIMINNEHMVPAAFLPEMVSNYHN